MSILYFSLVTAVILGLALAYLFIFTTSSSMADHRALFAKAFLFAFAGLVLNGLYFLG